MVDAEYAGIGEGWTEIATALVSANVLTDETVARICLLDDFGTLIANTDRHPGNLALLTGDTSFELAPIYDMLPMYFAPERGEVIDRDPWSLRRAVSDEARTLAGRYWERVLDSTEVSAEFRTLVARDKG
ncbi:MAG: hypothetical protein DRQ37_02985 [Gammaproteobacteria bacterium]|nr:MAG: hypothetical protein DRQ37_02985 [Gammaproteobacteria bacterium]